ncbi:hypothetical protein BGX34_004676 [Mortierella sp. NVP85]|nr:hypothetical protein BGX34_004676 [Mortierella sp. NVP85]
MTTPDVYVISFNSGIVIDRGIDAFWKSVCRKLRVRNPKLFDFDESTVSSATFEGFFRKQDSSRPIILLFDEVSWIVGKDAAVVDSFLGMLRLLKGDRNQHCLHAMALVGVQTIKKLLKSPTSLSPFTSETTITPERFKVADVEGLLRQYSVEACVELDAAAIGQDIFERTLGHKGLVGTCCRALVNKVVNHGGHVLVEEWQKYASVGLLGFTRERETYARIIRSLPNLLPTQLQTVGVVLRNGSTIAQVSDELEELLAEGILIERPTETENETRTEIHVECAAPILRNLMIYHVSGPIPKIFAPPSTTDELDAEWLLARTVENIAPQHVFTQQTSNSSGNPSEYAFQFEFASVMKHLLSETYPGLLYRVPPEAKERDENGQRRRRLDILVRDHDRPPFGFELLVQGNDSEIDDHLERSKYYRDLHDCRTVYMINLTNATTNYYGGTTYAGVIPLHVVYDRDQGTALIKYKDRHEQVSFCAKPWNMVFS